jgi:selenocysteine lyase/cysteine desulfurase
LDPAWTFINHGAFGSSLRPVAVAAKQWQERMEAQPLRFLDRELLPLLVYTTRQLAQFVRADPRDIVLVPNATTGLNTVLQSLPLRQGDKILALNIGYGSVKKMVNFVCAATGAVFEEYQLKFPVSSAAKLVKRVENFVKLHHKEAKLIIFDYITSNSGLLLPVQSLTEMCRKYSVPVLIDGAHSLGSVDLDLKQLQPDYFVANAHKWMCSSKGCALLYVSRANQHLIHPLNISHGYGSGFTCDFVWTGLTDYGPWLSLLTCIDFWNKTGPDIIRSYIYSLVRQASDMLLKAWGTDTFGPDELYGPMITVRLPGPRIPVADEANKIQDALHFQFRIECPVKLLQNRLYVRISAHLYNNMQDYVNLCDAMLQIRPRLSAEEDAIDLENAEMLGTVCTTGSCG